MEKGVNAILTLNAKKKNIVITLLILIFISAILAVGYIYIKNAPIRTVNAYLNARYNINYNNIKEKVAIQKELFDESILDAGYTYTNFDNDIKMFKDNKIKIELR